MEQVKPELSWQQITSAPLMINDTLSRKPLIAAYPGWALQRSRHNQASKAVQAGFRLKTIRDWGLRTRELMPSNRCLMNEKDISLYLFSLHRRLQSA